MADLTAKLRLDPGTFDSDLKRAKQSTTQFAEGLANAGRTAGQKLKNGLTTASVATGVLAGGLLAITKNLTVTGGAYNMLQQNSRAALRTIMGDGKLANAQMDKLDAFARNSPFAKDVFIKSQQQLLGFGVEAKKVIPIMDAVQQAVAATGGSSDDVGALVDVLAKVKGQGKITGETLQQLGERGIDAASIIGDSMGKSGQQIRDEISKGAIGADQALEILTKGLATKFDGATAAIKQQMTGALDRVKGASRDIGSALAEPFIRKNGGGRMVEWTNQFADLLRAAEKQTGPLVNALTRKLNPAFNDTSTLLVEAKNAVNGFDVADLEWGMSKLAGHAPGIAAITAGFAAMGTQLPILKNIGFAINPLAAGITALVMASPELRGVLSDALAAGEPLVPVLVELAGTMSGALNSAIGSTVPLLESGVDVLDGLVQAGIPVIGLVGDIVEGFSNLPGPVQSAVLGLAAIAALKGKFNWMGDLSTLVSTKLVTGFQRFRAEMDGLHSIQAPNIEGALTTPLKMLDRQIDITAGNSRSGFGRLVDGARVAGRGITSGLKGALTGVMNVFGGPWGIALGAGVMALSAYSQAQAEAKARTQEFKGTLDEATGAITDASNKMAADALAMDKGSKGWFGSGADAASETLKNLGKSVQDTAGLIAEGGQDYDSFIEKLRQFEDASAAAGIQVDNMGNVISQGDGGQALENWRLSMGLTSEAMNQLSSVSITHLIGQLEKQRGSLADASSQVKAMNDSMNTAPEVQSRVAEAIKAVGDAAADSTTRISAYKQIIDLLNGVVPTQEAQQRSLATTSRTLGEFFNETGEKGKKLHKGLIDAKTGAVEFSDAGDRLMGMLTPLQDQALAAALAASDHEKALGNEAGAAAAADAALAPYRAQIKQLGEDGKITKEQAEALSTALFGMPGETSVAITDGGSAEALALKLQDIYQLVMGAPDGSITITENSPEVIAGLEALGFTVENVPGTKKIVVSETGADSTGKKIDGVAGKKRSSTIDTKAATQAAESALKTTARKRDTTIYATASTGTAEGQLNNLARDRVSRVRVITTKETYETTGRGGSGGITRAAGGPIYGPGSGTSDDVPIMASNGEHMWTASEVRAAGGHKGMYQLRAMVRQGLLGIKGFAKGGAIYRVKNGDTLAEIAQRFGTTWQKLASSNGIKNANRIYVGQSIEVPSSGSSSSKSGGKAKAKAQPKPSRSTRKVDTSGWTGSQFAQRQADVYADEVGDIKDVIADRKKAVKAAESRYNKAKGKNKNKKSAQKSLDKAKSTLAKSEKTLDKYQQKLQDQKAKVARLYELEYDLSQDLRRNEVVDAFKSGSGMSKIDQLFDLSRNKDLSKGKRRAANASARSAEKQLLNLEAAAERVASKLEVATDKYQELLGVKNQVKDSLSGEFQLSDMLSLDTLKAGPLNAGMILGSAKEKASQIRGFARKLDQLRKMGYAAVIIQEVAALGTNEGSYVADALLAGSKSEMQGINKAYSDIETYAGAAGNNVTKALYKGGVQAAEGLVKGLESQQKNIEKATENLGKIMEAALKRALGIKSPSRKARLIAENFAGTLADNLISATPKVSTAAAGLGGAITQGTQGSLRQPLVGTNTRGHVGQPERPTVVQHNKIYYPVAEPTSVSVERASSLLQL
ncbi:tape measure protein [Glutamicibacter protophormiae]|uniref:tape measure protein n=1 Tax=Glutamicibacter protophormiae TaxID=37930 RepID=UPI003A8D1F55